MTDAPKPPDALPAQGDALFAERYHELHRLARREAFRFGPAGSLGATTLLQRPISTCRSAQASASATAPSSLPMRHARCARWPSTTRAGGLDITSLGTLTAESCADPAELSHIGEALDELAVLDAELATVVDLKFFCGFTIEEIAALQAGAGAVAHRHQAGLLEGDEVVGGVGGKGHGCENEGREDADRRWHEVS